MSAQQSTTRARAGALFGQMDSGCRRLKHLMRAHTEMSEDKKQHLQRDPLIALVQIEEEDNLTIREEAVALLEMLLENVEEFYELREKIIDLIEDDEMTENKLIDLFQTLLSSELTDGRTGLARAKVK